MGNSAEVFWRHKQSFVEAWISYYINQEPESLYVATKEDSIVGYLTGCLNTSLAPKSEDIYNSMIKKYGLLFRPGTAGFFYWGMLDSILDKITGKPLAKGEFIDER